MSEDNTDLTSDQNDHKQSGQIYHSATTADPGG